MPDPISPFRTTLLPVDAALAPHANLVPGILVGRGGPIRVERDGERVEGDMLLIRAGAVHSVDLPARGADILYLNGLAFASSAPLAEVLDGKLVRSMEAVLRGDADATEELRTRLTPASAITSPAVAETIRAIYADPMRRMSQRELAQRLGLERTRALRCFKAATGQSFRQFKLWSAMQYAAEQMKGGALVRTAAMDAGFADTAHLSRLFHQIFGLTPSAAIAGLSRN